jgi:predicted nucleic acid-binding protein
MDEVQTAQEPLERILERIDAIIQELQDLRQSVLYPRLAPHLERLRTFPDLYLVDVTPSDLSVMDEAMRRYPLRPCDALHLAAMRKSSCVRLVSGDPDSDRVPERTRYTL